MKQLLLSLLLLAGLGSHAQSKDEKAILAMLEKQNQAWNRGDVAGFMKGYWENDSLMFVGKSGITYGYKNTLENYKKGYPDATAMGQLTTTQIKVIRVSSRYYFIVGKWHLKRTIGDLSGHYNLLLQKINGEWVIIADHSS